MSKRVSKDDSDRFHDYGIYIPSRTIYMGSEIVDLNDGESGCDALMAERTIKNLTILESINKDPITILMNNIGGDEFHCFAIIDAITSCESHVKIVAMGHAMSCGSLILQAADERVMASLAVQMIHYGTFASNDHSKTFQKWAQEGHRIDKWMEQWYMAKILKKNPKFKLKKLQEMLNFDSFLSAEESVRLGLADKVLGEEEHE